MSNLKVKDIMLPLEKYTSVSEEATLEEVFLALEGALKGREKADPEEARDFAVLVFDKDGRVVGRLAAWDVLLALKPQSMKRVDPLAMVERYDAWAGPLAHLASKAQNLRAKDIIRALNIGEYIGEDASLDEAVSRLLDNRFLSLIVMRGRDPVGILRIVDVFQFVCDKLRSELE